VAEVVGVAKVIVKTPPKVLSQKRCEATLRYTLQVPVRVGAHAIIAQPPALMPIILSIKKVSENQCHIPREQN
jgi:hypothetical protein